MKMTTTCVNYLLNKLIINCKHDIFDKNIANFKFFFSNKVWEFISSLNNVTRWFTITTIWAFDILCFIYSDLKIWDLLKRSIPQSIDHSFSSTDTAKLNWETVWLCESCVLSNLWSFAATSVFSIVGLETIIICEFDREFKSLITNALLLIS